MPTGQVFKWHFRIIVHPRTIKGAVEKPNSSAPRMAATTTSNPAQKEKEMGKDNHSSWITLVRCREKTKICSFELEVDSAWMWLDITYSIDILTQQQQDGQSRCTLAGTRHL